MLEVQVHRVELLVQLMAELVAQILVVAVEQRFNHTLTQVVGAAPPQLPSARHVRVPSPPPGPWPAAVQEYVATLPAHWSSLYEIEMPSTAGSDAHDTCAKTKG